MMKRPSPPKVPLPNTQPLKKPAAKPQPTANKGEVSSIGEIFAAAFRLYAKRVLPMLAVTLLGQLFTLLTLAGLGIGVFFALGLDGPKLQQFFNDDIQRILADPSQVLAHPFALPLLGGGILLFLIAVLFFCWAQTSVFVAAVDEQHGIIESLCTGWKYIFPMLWISSLYLGILLTASLFFILPALILSVSMSFWIYVMVDEDRRGIDALMASRLYVRGHWWDTFFKMLLMNLAVAGLIIPLSFLPLVVQFPGQQIVLRMIQFFIMMFSIVFMVTVYRDLKQAAGKIDTDSTCRCLWMPMALVGIILPLLWLIGLFVAFGPKLPDSMERIRTQLLEQIRQTAEQQGISLPLPPRRESASNTAPTVQTVSSVDGFIIWRDPVGDARNPLLDIRQVSSEGKQGALVLAVELAKPLAEYFAAQKDDFDPLVNFYFDTDLNPATGGALSGEAGRAGYDLHLEILLAKDKPYASLYRLDGQQKQSLEPLAEDTLAVSSSSLTVRLPYGRLSAAAGGKIRACFREAAQLEGSGLGIDQIVPLK